VAGKQWAEDHASEDDLLAIEKAYGGPAYHGAFARVQRDEQADSVVSAAAAVMGMGDQFNAEAFLGAVLEAWGMVKGEIEGASGRESTR
jgi:hypothetical protein